MNYTHTMEIRRFITVLDKYLHLISETDKVELMHTIALGLEEEGHMDYTEIRNLLKLHGCSMPKELLCRECMEDTGELMLDCYWCGRYFHHGCNKCGTTYCSKQCEKIDTKTHS